LLQKPRLEEYVKISKRKVNFSHVQENGSQLSKLLSFLLSVLNFRIPMPQIWRFVPSGMWSSHFGASISWHFGGS